MLQLIGKSLMIFGAVLLILGAVLFFSNRIPWIGRLPGDVIIRKKDFVFYFPIVSCILISAIVSLVFFIISRLMR